MDNTSNYQFKSLIKNSNYILRDHRVHDVRLMPGVTFLDMIYTFLESKGFTLNEMEIKNMLFVEPVSTTEHFDKMVTIDFKYVSDHWKISINSEKYKDGAPIGGTPDHNGSCELHVNRNMLSHKIHIDDLKTNAIETFDLEQVYTQARRVNIVHYEFMKALGSCYQGDDYILAEIHLGELAQKNMDAFYFQPTYLDCSTFFPLFFHDVYEVKPYIPIYIESFRGYRKPGEVCYVYVEKPGTIKGSSDMRFNDYAIYNSDGDIVARFKKYSAKLIRNRETISRLEVVEPDSVKSGEIDRGHDSGKPVKEPASPAKSAVGEVVSPEASKAAIEATLKEIISGVSGLSPSRLKPHLGYYDQGLDSNHLLKVVQKLEKAIGHQLYPTLLFEYPTIDELKDYFFENHGEKLLPHDTPGLKAINDSAASVNRNVEKNVSLDYYQYCLKETSFLPAASRGETETILMFIPVGKGNAGADGPDKVKAECGENGTRLITIEAGTDFRVRKGDSYEMNLGERDNYKTLFHRLQEQNVTYTKMVFFIHDAFSTPPSESIEEYTQSILGPILALTRALMEDKVKGEVKLIYLYGEDSDNNPVSIFHRSMGGLFRSLIQENPHYEYKTVGTAKPLVLNSDTMSLLKRELASHNTGESEVKYDSNSRYSAAIDYLESEIKGGNIGLKNKGLYIITGGAGGLGLLFAEYITQNVEATIILTGRSQLSRAKQAELRKLQSGGSKIVYARSDISSLKEVQVLREMVLSKFGPVSGIIHSAGVIRDSYVINKDDHEYNDVISPKVLGAVWLDRVFEHDHPDFFVLFSSLSGIMGNAGQSDYAFANRYLDHFARWRNTLVDQGKRHGHTISIDWPLWKDGGLTTNDDKVQWLREYIGLELMEKDQGAAAFETALQHQLSHIIPVVRDPSKFDKIFNIEKSTGGKSISPVHIAATKTRPSAVYGEKRSREDIAVIGMSGRYPKAKDVHQYWQNLKDSIDCITEIPSERWDYTLYFDENPDNVNYEKMYTKWGGFIDDVDKFDPLFFNISPIEAEMQDPQERIFIETVWHTIEDAGYAASAFTDTSVGVFVGLMWGHYQLFGGEISAENPIATTSYGSIANHVSYLFNFRGPSIALDTMCSSSITAVHLACESICGGECDMAVAGGVNTSLHPKKYIQLSSNRFMSTDGRCRSFGEGGDGYVPGEGVGALLLKRLSAAENDNDRIYAVIKGSSLNHGGRTGGYTVPSPKAQAELIVDAFEKTGINPRTISCIEAHGTGTSLGDPIEIEGLKKSFKKYTKDRQFCSIGSVKSNIGHLEGAAGVAAITKVILQMQYSTLVPSLHSRELNRQIDFSGSPFYVQQELAEWKRPVFTENGTEVTWPRRAGVSAFGAGGANAHIILEEYQVQHERSLIRSELYLFILSARDRERLIEYAQNIVHYIEVTSDIHNKSRNGESKHQVMSEMEEVIIGFVSHLASVSPHEINSSDELNEFTFDAVLSTKLAITIADHYSTDLDDLVITGQMSISDICHYLIDNHSDIFYEKYAIADAEEEDHDFHLPSVAYTLQVGREAMEERLAVIAADKHELIEKLNNYINGTGGPYVYHGNIYDESAEAQSGSRDDKAVQQVLADHDLEKLAQIWTSGADIDWKKMYGEAVPQKVSLPGYPFARERYWIEEGENHKHELSQLHPLVGANESTIDEQCYRKVFSPKEPMIEDHQVNGYRVVAGALLTEMARVCGDLAQRNGKVSHIHDIVWHRPVIVGDDEEEVVTVLWSAGDDSMDFEITDVDGDVYVSGSLLYGNTYEDRYQDGVTDRDAVKSRCDKTITEDECYRLFSSIGFQYGRSFRSVSNISYNDNECLALLELPGIMQEENGTYVINPFLLDGALQSTAIIVREDPGNSSYIPYRMEEIVIHKPLTTPCYAYVQKKESSDDNEKRFSLRIMDESGEVSVAIDGLVLRAQAGFGADKVITKELVSFGGAWHEADIPAAKEKKIKGPLLVFDDNDELKKAFSEYYSEEIVLVVPGKTFTRKERLAYAIDPVEGSHYMKLFEQLHNDGIVPSAVVHCWSSNSTTFNLELNLDFSVLSLFEVSKTVLTLWPGGNIALIRLYKNNGSLNDPLNNGITGFLRTVRLEHGTVNCKNIIFHEDRPYSSFIVAIVDEMTYGEQGVHEIRYDGNKRYIKKYTPLTIDKYNLSPLPLKEHGHYIITGGAGGIGYIFARYLAKSQKANLVLCGRSTLNAARAALLRELESFGSQVLYVAGDVSRKEDLRTIIDKATERFGAVNGIIHSAGIVADAFLREKEKEQFIKVIAPKVTGTVCLDEITKDMDLDLFVLFSSASGVLGNAGQSDYAYANSFMNSFAAWRQELVEKQERKGKTVSIAWPYWQEGGMTVDDATQQWMEEVLGIVPLSNNDGISFFEEALNSSSADLMVFSGNKHIITGTIDAMFELPHNDKITAETLLSESESEVLNAKTEEYLKRLLVTHTKVSMGKINPQESLERFGLNSVKIMNMTRELEREFGTLPKTLFFEYQTIDELKKYFIKTHIVELQSLFNIKDNTGKAATQFKGKEDSMRPVRKKVSRRRHLSPGKQGKRGSAEDIAIIGVSGRYPGSNDLEEFWTNLKEGTDCISVIPSDRWDYAPYYDEDRSKPDRTYCKWGGFIERADHFDPLFFTILPAEAKYIDPQERLFLETVWKTIEDAGHTRSTLDQEEVGVYVGVMYGEYQLYRNEHNGYIETPRTSYASIANRVSYFFNFTGPSVALDTMCSSSLVAVHLACEAINKGDITMAVAGGVNLSIHPNKYFMLSSGQFLSTDGRCRSFGEGGDGYVPGEGVGALLLKGLSRAIDDRDSIYALIKGTAINHGGKTNGYTVPNPNEQANVIGKALKNSGIDARTISYIEAHGTGTSLGDPIEIAGLTKAFERYGSDKHYCSVGSVKSNIGHLEAAAGMAAITKVLLQMKHRQLVPSLHSGELNSNIDFAASPFYVQQELEHWSVPEIAQKAGTMNVPRRAGISSFGAGGANAHIILEEYTSMERPYHKEAECPFLFVISAKKEKNLKVYAEKMARYMESIKVYGEENSKEDNGEYNLTSLRDIAYTLQTGREHMEERLAFVAQTKEEVISKLLTFAKDENSEHLYYGRILRQSPFAGDLIEGKEGNEFFKVLLQEKKYDKLARLWVSGVDIEWTLLYENHSPRRVSLETYPFIGERYWVSPVGSADRINGTGFAASKLHPLVSSNRSTFKEQKFTTVFTGNEFYLKDHVVGGKQVLPGVAYIEMVRAAVSIAAEEDLTRLGNITWLHPVVVDEGAQEVVVNLYPARKGITFKIESQQGDNHVVHSQGMAWHGAATTGPGVTDVDKIKKNSAGTLDAEEHYRIFSESGVVYGAAFRPVKKLYYSNTEALSFLELPACCEKGFDDYCLHPSLLDGAFQTVVGLIANMKDAPKLYPMPYALTGMTIYAPIPQKCYAHVREEDKASEEAKSRVKKYTIDLLTPRGEQVLTLQGLTFRVLEDTTHEKNEVLCFREEWEQRPYGHDKTIITPGVAMVFDAGEELSAALSEGLAGNDVRVITVTQGRAFADKGDLVYVVDRDSEDDYHRVFESLKKKNLSVASVFYCWPLLNCDPDYGHYFQMLRFSKALMKWQPKEKTRVAYVYAYEDVIDEHHGAMSGFAKTVNHENLKLIYKTVGIKKREKETGAVFADQLLCEFFGENEKDTEVLLEPAVRLTRTIKEINADQFEKKRVPFENNRVYIITGGLGGLGYIFASHIANAVKAVLILTGRSPLNDKGKEKIERLAQKSGVVHYLQCDVSDRDQVQKLIREVKSRFGSIHGIIHSAGLIHDSYIDQKSEEEARQVFSAKINGTRFMHEETKDEPLDFFVLFSSLAAVFGNAGQSDYAYGNRFMDHFAEARDARVKKGECCGQTISINWPFWQEGGMQVDNQAADLMRTVMGIVPLQTEAGIQAFDLGFSLNTNFMVIQGDPQKIKKYTGPGERQVRKKATPQPSFREGAEAEMTTELENDLVAIVASILKSGSEEIDIHEDIQKYGFESLTLAELSNRINKKYSLELMPTLFYELEEPTIASLGAYLLDEYGDILKEHYQGEPKGTVLEIADFTFENSIDQHTRFDYESSAEIRSIEDDIAVVGMWGIMPQSENLDEYWKNLEEEKCLITTVPEDRWDYREFEGFEGSAKWGGFIDNVDRFDSLFFNISPLEAELMDPQQRIFLELVWKTIEDAGYRASDLSGSRTALYVGVFSSDYADIVREAPDVFEAHVTTGLSHTILANRISYIFNFHGPSEPVDTACSSSLIAIHRSVESIRSGTCDMAIAGGINLMLSPIISLYASVSGMLSKDGRCMTFDERANGYVRGEGAGAVFLKPLGKAEADGDHIYGVVKGTFENHGGRAKTITSPNANAQADLLIHTYERSGIDPTTITYIETHGTGTGLGDPVEINGLKKAFKHLYKLYGKEGPVQAHCGLGAVKTNVGHLEAAAGIAGVLKVLLSLKNKKIPATVNFKKLNPYVQLQGSPFYIVDKTRDWVPLRDKHNRPVPRRAGVSSFGFGGANAHIIFEEYENSGVKSEESADSGPFVFVLSAKSRDILNNYVATYIDTLKETTCNPLHIMYTLQTGREAMQERIAVVASSMREVAAKLEAYLEGGEEVAGCFCGTVKQNQKSDNTENNELDNMLREKKIDKIAQAWTEGANINWAMLYENRDPKRVSLPTYPFAETTYWVDQGGVESGIDAKGAIGKLHPLVDRNTSILSEQRFATDVRSDALMVNDFPGRSIVPSSVYPEMVRAAGELANEQWVCSIYNAQWHQHLSVSSGKEAVSIGFYPEDDEVACSVTCRNSDSSVETHFTASLIYGEKSTENSNEQFDIDEIIERCNPMGEGGNIYDSFNNRGIEYGKGLLVIKELYCNDEGDEAIASIGISENNDTDGGYVVHPALFEGVLQSLAVMENRNNEVSFLPVPVAFEEMHIYGGVPGDCYLYVECMEGKGRVIADKSFNIFVLDKEGREKVSIHGLTVKRFEFPDGGGSEDNEARIREILRSVENGEMTIEEADLILGEV